MKQGFWLSGFLLVGTLLLFNGCLMVADGSRPVGRPGHGHGHHGGVRLIESGPIPAGMHYVGRIQARDTSREGVRAELRHKARRMRGDVVRVHAIRRVRHNGRVAYRATGKVYRYR